MHARRLGSPRLLFVPTTLELEALRSLGGFGRELGLVETCGFGPVASAARAAQRIATLAPRAVVLVGIAGSYDLDRAPIASAQAFDAVSIEGVGAGSGACTIGAAALGFAQWRGADGRTIGDRIELAKNARGSASRATLLLTVCAASTSPSDAYLRREHHPDALAEDMEGFGVAMACAMAGVPLSIVRGISNAAGDRDRERWRVNDALRAARDLVEKTLDADERALASDGASR